jgi:hypothetical protein
LEIINKTDAKALEDDDFTLHKVKGWNGERYSMEYIYAMTAQERKTPYLKFKIVKEISGEHVHLRFCMYTGYLYNKVEVLTDQYNEQMSPLISKKYYQFEKLLHEKIMQNTQMRLKMILGEIQIIADQKDEKWRVS